MQGDIKSKPVLFNTAMVQAILDGRKTVTRRIVKPHREAIIENVWLDKNDGEVVVVYNDNNRIGEKGYIKTKYQVGDVLWVRETWAKIEDFENNFGFDIDDGLKYLFKCDDNGKAHNSVDASVKRWRPSIHMPKEAARIFLKVTDVRVERLQGITWEQCLKEGIEHDDISESPDLICNFCHYEESQQGVKNYGSGPVFCSDGCGCEDAKIIYEDDCIYAFQGLWNSTVHKKHFEKLGWDANPWVWVIEFERCENAV